MLFEYPNHFKVYAREALSVTLKQCNLQVAPVNIGADTIFDKDGKHLSVRCDSYPGQVVTAHARVYPDAHGDSGRLHLHHLVVNGQMQLPQNGQTDMYVGRDDNGLPKLVQAATQAAA